MYWIACILLGSAVLGGLARLVIYFTGREGSLPKSEGVMGRERHLLLAFLYVFSSGLGFFWLSTETVEPVGILIGLPMMVIILEVTLRKGSVDPF
jgi:hypothetical protein